MLPDGWYTATIVDIDPEYHAKTSPQRFRILKIQVQGSLRYGKRTFNFYVGEDFQTNRQDGGSARQDLINRFGMDVWNDEEADKFLDLEVRTHIGITTMPTDRGHIEVNRVISVYPVTWQFTEKGTTNGDVDSQSEQEIPF